GKPSPGVPRPAAADGPAGRRDPGRAGKAEPARSRLSGACCSRSGRDRDRLRGLEATASKRTSNTTGALLLRLESRLATLSDRHATSLHESNETQERLQNELVWLHT